MIDNVGVRPQRNPLSSHSFERLRLVIHHVVVSKKDPPFYQSLKILYTNLLTTVPPDSFSKPTPYTPYFYNIRYTNE